MKNIFLLCFLFLFYCNTLFAQYEEPKNLKLDLDFGVLAEMGILYLERSSDITVQTASSVKLIETKNISSAYPFSLYLSGRLNFTDYLSLEFRPGIFLGGDEYSGFELGFLLRYKFWKDKIFAAGGVNFHFNSGAGHGTYTSSTETFTYYGLNLGINMSKSLAFIASYYYHPDKEFLYSVYNWQDYSFDRYLLKDVLKIGFDLTF